MPLVDLDDPEELRARWSALAAVAHATGYDRRWYADEHGWYHQDETGSDLRMVRLDGGRAVLFGFHTQHTQTAEADLLAGAPDWIGQPEVKRRIAAGDLGFVYGSFNGTWARASYPGDPWQPLDDGFLPIGEWITSDEEAAREMIEWAAEWADYLGGLDDLLPIGVDLIRTAATTGITLESLLGLFERLGIGPHSPQHPDLQAALTAATAFDSTTTHPSAPAAAPAGAYTASDYATEAPAANDYAAGDYAVGAPASDYAAGDYGVDAPAIGIPAIGTPAASAPVVGAAGAAAYVGEGAGAQPDVSADEDAPTDGAGFEPIDEDEESVVVPPGISPFTGQPIGDDANLVIGGSEPFRPEPPFTPEPPFRPDSPFAPEPPPHPPEPPYAPQPEDDPPYQPETADARADGYGVVAKKPRLFRRRKHEDQEPAPNSGPPPAGTPYAGGSAEGDGQYSDGGPAAGTPYSAPAQHEPQTPPMVRPLPSSEPPRVGGPVNDGEDFYASLFADAPAAATYVPDVVRNTPATPPGWSADDATSELTAVPADPAATNTPPAPVTPDDDTGVITPVAEDTPETQASAPSEAPPTPHQQPAAPHDRSREPHAQTPPEAPHVPPTPTPSPFAPPLQPPNQAGTPHEGTREPHGQAPTSSPFAPPLERPHQTGTPHEGSRDPHGQAPAPQEPTHERAATSSPFAPAPEPFAPAPERDEPQATSESLETPSSPFAPTSASYEPEPGKPEATPELFDAPTGPLEPITEYDAADAEPEPAPEPALAQREWIGGAWINGVWVEDVAAYLAAQNAAGPTQPTAPAPTEQPTTEHLHTEQPSDQAPLTEELRTEDIHAQEPPTEDLRQEDIRDQEPLTEDLRTEDFRAQQRPTEAPPAEQFHAEEPPTEGRFLDLAEFDSSAEAPSAEAGPGQDSPGEEPHTEERLLGLSGSGVLAEEASGEASGGDAEQVVVPDDALQEGSQESVRGEVSGGADDGLAQAEDEAPTAEIAAIVEEDPEDEYYASASSPFAPQARDLPPNGFSSLEPLSEPDYRMGEDEFHDQIIGEADWTADQLGDLPATEVTAQIAPIQDPEATQDSDSDQYADPQPPTDTRDLEAGEVQGGPLQDDPAPSQSQSGGSESAAAYNGHLPGGEFPGREAAGDVRSSGELSGGAVGAAGGVVAAAGVGATAGTGVDARAAEGAAAGEVEVEGEGSGGAGTGVPERLVVPDAGGAVAIPGLGVVGGDGPRVEAVPGSIEEAMRAEVERPRPRPKETAALRALRDWCRARTKVVPSGFTIQVQVLDPAAPSYRFDLEPPAVDDPQYGDELLTELLGDLWIAESQGEQGGWLFARVDAAGRTLRIDRWYDSVPDWWDNPVESRLDVHGLVRRLNDRGPDWQPSYLEKLYTTAR